MATDGHSTFSSTPQTPIERIKQKLDILEEIGAVVTLRKSGKAFKGLCPFHGERTPSFYVFPETGTWRCFGCNEGGDIFSFVEKQQGFDFAEALSMLAERAGVTLERSYGGITTAEEAAETATRKRLRALNESAAIWFHHQLLQASEAQYARTYLESRGVNNESLALWRLGFAPDGDALTRYLMSQGYTQKELVEAGFTREREPNNGRPGGLYDYFRNRLIFPIRDARGQTIAFGGRDLAGGTPKYLNSPQSLLFDKSATLYGFDLARDAIKRNDRVVIVEGYMDAIVTHQYGTRNVVACIGSAITEKHIRQIKKLTRRVTLALDPDAAGESAAARGIVVAQQAFDRVAVPVPVPMAPSHRPGAQNRRNVPQGMVRFEEQVDAEITVARLPAHEDPDEFVRRDPDGWRHAITEAQPLIDFLIDTQTAGLALDTPQGKLEARRRLLPVIAQVRDRTLADDYVGRLAQKLRLDKIDLRRDLSATRQRLDREAQARPPLQTSAHAAQAKQATHDSDDTSSVENADTVGGKSYEARQERSERGGGSSAAIGAIEEVHARRASLAGQLAQSAEHALETYCVGLALAYPVAWGDLQAILEPADFTSAETRAIFVALADEMEAITVLQQDLSDLPADADLPTFDPAAFEAALHPALAEVAAQAQEQVATEGGGVPEGADPTHVARDAAYRLKRMRLKAQMAELDALQRDAEQSHDADTLRALLIQKQRLLTQRRTIDAASALFG